MFTRDRATVFYGYRGVNTKRFVLQVMELAPANRLFATVIMTFNEFCIESIAFAPVQDKVASHSVVVFSNDFVYWPWCSSRPSYCDFKRRPSSAGSSGEVIIQAPGFVLYLFIVLFVILL